jgi:hypothetical protein
MPPRPAGAGFECTSYFLLQILALSLCTSTDDIPAFKFEAPANAGARHHTVGKPVITTMTLMPAAIAKGANSAIQQLQSYHKSSFASGGKRRQLLPLCHLPLADMRMRNWQDQMPESLLGIHLGTVVHLPRDAAAGGDSAISGAAVFTHSHVIPPMSLFLQTQLFISDASHR